MERLLSDEPERARLRRLGLAQAGRFTWRATAAGTVATYRQTLLGERALS